MGDVVQLLGVAVEASDIPEWQEVTAITGRDDGGNATHLILIGPDDGTPFTVTSSTTNAGTFNIVVTEVQKGAARVNQKVRMRLAGPPTSGTFGLLFGSSSVTGINFDVAAATFQTTLEGMVAIGAGNVSVVKNGKSDWTIEFIGALAGKRQPIFSFQAMTTLAGGGGLAITMVQEYRPANYAKGPLYTLTATDTVTAFRFKFTGDATFSGLTYLSDWVANAAGATADDIRFALESIMVPATLVSDTATADPHAPNVPAYTKVDVTGPAGGPWTILIRDGIFPAMNANALFIGDEVYKGPNVKEGAFGNVVLAFVSGPNTALRKAIQHIALTGAPTGGTIVLDYGGQAVAVAWNASAATLKTNLESLSSIGTVTVTGTGTLHDPWIVTFDTDTEVLLMTGSGTSLTGTEGRAEIIADGQPGTNEQQEVTITSGTPTGGNFTLTFNAETTTPINFSASAATVQAALEGLTAFVPGDILCTGGPLPANPVMVEFQGGFANSNLNLMTGNGTSLVAASTQTLVVSANTVDPTGPNWLDEPLNWSGSTNPVAGDKCFFANIETEVLYDRATITDTMAEVHFMASFVGQFGLKPVSDTGYFQYRSLYPQLRSTLTIVGEGTGTGSPYININNGTIQTELIVMGTGSPEDSSIPALHWKGTNASNVVRVFKGSFGVALYTAEVATIATLQIGYLEDREGDVEYAIGPGITVTTIEISGGNGEINLGTANATSLSITGGIVVLAGTFGVSTTFVIAPDEDETATVIWKTTGTLGGAPVVSGEGKLDFSQDMRTKTVTNPIEVNSLTSIVDDPKQVVSNLRLDLNYTAANLNSSRLGSNVRITRGAPS
ncbi:MAG: hypothetical protein L0211_09140 [Planctomycetaceae bacterium]|nr:hypothetical protein [Planctomycetaceae bacterium]